MKILRVFAAVALTLLCMSAGLKAQSNCQDQGTWTMQTFPYGAIDAPLLLTDGRVMAQYVGPTQGNQFDAQDWYALSPDINGSYTNPNNWAELTSPQPLWGGDYAPFAFASAVLADGRVIVQGGEHNVVGPDDTDMGVIFQPVGNGGAGGWSQLTIPPGWNGIGDAASVVLPNEMYMVAGCCGEGNEQAQLNPSNLSWNVLSNNGKHGGFFEQGWTLLPGVNGNVLTVDTGSGTGLALYEIFNTTTNTWSNYPIPVILYGNYPSLAEIGPAIQLVNGNVLATGAANGSNSSTPPPSAGNTGIYNPATNSWTVGPSFPNYAPGNVMGMGDEMAALLPEGNVLLAAHDTLTSPGNYEILKFLYQNQNPAFCVINAPPDFVQNAYSSSIKLLVLPTGQVLVTKYHFQGTTNPTYYIYTPPTPNINNSWRPVITSVNSNLNHGSINNTISGLQFNGLTQGSMYGDDFQNATNYPLVQITNNATHHVFYARTHNHNTMAIATGMSFTTTTMFDIPSNTETGQSSLVVIANGIPSMPFTVTIH